jgi:hypothetical protein
MEPVNARISKEWRRRMLFMFAMIFGIAAWFLTDGYIIWPNEAERYEAYSELRDELIETGEIVDEESPEMRIAWQKYARQADITAKVPKERTDAAIKEQVVIGWTLTLISLSFAAWIAWNHKLSIRTEGDTVIGASGQRVEIDSIVGMDRKKWKNKGIAYAIYKDGEKEKRLCLDEHKFKGAEAIILEAERRIAERTGGDSERGSA